MSELVEVCNEGKTDYSTQDNFGQGIPCADDGPLDAVVTSSNSVKDGQLAISGVEKVKDPERRRSKSGRRRSGFSRGRVSLTMLSREASAADTDTVGSELYKQIPVELSAAERLGLLSRLQLRCTLEILDKQFEDVPGFENFKAEGVLVNKGDFQPEDYFQLFCWTLESVGAVVDQMERDGTFHQACTTPSLAPNPVNLQMDSTIGALSSCIRRLEKEDTEWNELVSTLETQAGHAEQQLKQLEVEHRDLPEDVKQLSLSFLPQPSDVPDLAAICTDTVRDVKTMSLLMEDYSHSMDLLNIVHEAAGRHMDRVTATLGEAYSCHQRDPKESIQRLLAS